VGFFDTGGFGIHSAPRRARHRALGPIDGLIGEA